MNTYRVICGGFGRHADEGGQKYGPGEVFETTDDLSMFVRTGVLAPVEREPDPVTEPEIDDNGD